MKKKVLSALLVAVLAVSMLAGCGDGRCPGGRGVHRSG